MDGQEKNRRVKQNTDSRKLEQNTIKGVHKMCAISTGEAFMRQCMY